MSRVLRWSVYTRRQRAVALGLAFGSSATIGAGVWKRRPSRPTLADSGDHETATGSEQKSLFSLHNAPLAQRSPSSNTPAQSVLKTAAGTQPPPPQTKGHDTLHGEADLSQDSVTAWQSATNKISASSDSFTGFDFQTLRDKITNAVVPGWIRTLPIYIHKLQDELSGAPWSLGWEIWEDAHDPEINNEIIWDAKVRISKDLCNDEREFLRQRRKHTTKALAKYLGVPKADVHPDDVPVIAMCGSGGGLRALVSGASAGLCAQESGLLDCITYTSGVSGSCWLQTLFHSSIGRHDFDQIIQHLKQRIGIHIAYPPAALSLLSQAPTNKFLLSGFVEKLKGVPDAEFGLVDIYGLLLGARLLVPKGELNVQTTDLKVSNQQDYVGAGEAPLPIYTAVRHEIPAHLSENVTEPSKYAWHNTKHFDWFQWFEWTPYEFSCEELECGIPTWAVGRSWHAGDTAWRENGLALPELRVPLMMGIWGSAFCATLSHYYKEIRPILKTAGFAKLDGLLSGKDEDLVKVHPIDPAVIPNFALGLKDKLPETCPESIHTSSHLQLMDAGMSNNLPIYPLLRPGRNVDVIIAFDASADVKEDNWIKVVDGYVRQRGIKGWPMGAGWPERSKDEKAAAQQLHDAQAADAAKMNEVLEGTSYLQQPAEDLGYCNVWVGTTQERQEYMDEPGGKLLKTEDDNWHLMSPDAGIALIYFPFLANKKVPDVDPNTSDFMSTWNFIYTPEEIEKVVALARANYEEGKEQTRRTIRAVWERKRMLRLQREEEDLELRRQYRLRKNTHAMSDHFS